MVCGSLILRGLKNLGAAASQPRMLSGFGNRRSLSICLFYRRRFNALLAPDRLIRLSDDRNNFVFGIQ